METILIIIIIVLLLLILCCIPRRIAKMRGGKFKYQIIKPRNYDDDTYVMPKVEMLNTNDEFMCVDKNINPDVFWKMIMFKIINRYLDYNYNFLFEDDLDIKFIKNGIINSEIDSENYQNDIISKIPKSPRKICNVEYNENYYNNHYKKCINTDMLNVIRLYTNVTQKIITIDEMKQIEMKNLKFTHFHINYTNGLKFDSLYRFNKLDNYLINYIKHIDSIPNSIITINICKFDTELNYFIIEYQPDFEIETLYDYYCFIDKVHNNTKDFNFNYTINSLYEETLNKDKPKTTKYGYDIELKYPQCFIRKGDKELKFTYDKTELTLKYSSKKRHTDDCYMIKLLHASGLKQYIKTFCKTFLNIILNEKICISFNQLKPDKETFMLKTNDNNWVVPNPDNIIFK